MEKIDDSQAHRLNNDLLKSDEEEDGGSKKAKRNSKDDLIHKIHRVVDQYELEFDYSATKLKRMSKKELTQVLGEVVEQGVKYDMAKSVGVDPRANGKVVTLGALRMLHNCCAHGFEAICNKVAGPYMGYEIGGFARSMNDPTVQQSIDECLTEIAAENPEVLQYFDSPYSRLALVWSGCLLTCVKKKAGIINKNNATGMGSEARRREAAYRASRSGSPQERKVDRVHTPTVSNVVKV